MTMAKMTIERAIEILNPENREHYESIELVNEACRMGMEALKEKLRAKVITVADLDTLTPRYEVYEGMQAERCIGRKMETYGPMKPKYEKDGRKNGRKWASFDDLKYKGTPPWFRREVVKITLGGYSVGLYVKEE